VRRATGQHRQAVAGSGLVLLDRPAPLADGLLRGRLVVHHGSMLTSEEAAIAGRPQLLLPLYLEHLLTARTLAGTGAARVIRPGMSAVAIAAVVRDVRDGRDGFAAAQRLAVAVERELPAPDLPRRLVEGLL
jgi:UDP:flavonoid glycosyltransferase YjiC (YdhE family)